ncbi:unnamed protein product [Mytilus coruscus]|uniref:Uncharacterized protein n=1 Tax=Mytilus coruscus TaxID=42192 RepID=A0A6J8BWB2_MYTCO|nr:unnamed protein product [Mytilus coruscus]
MALNSNNPKLPHLGITRDSKSRFDSIAVVQERIGTARRATYAMMGAGLNGANGLNPCDSLHLIRIFIVPRLTYGLESIRSKLQSLNTTSGNYDSIEELAWRQLATNSNSSNSWFIMVKSLPELFDLPSCNDLLKNPPGKSTWKNLVISSVNSYWEQKLMLEAKTKSSLKYIDIDRLSIGKTHLIWSSACSNTYAIAKASVKCRMLLDVYTLQANRHRFNQFELDPSCPQCK